MNKEVIDLVADASLYSNILRLNVANFGELEMLIKDIKEKENALHEAVRNLEKFQLNILFTNE